MNSTFSSKISSFFASKEHGEDGQQEKFYLPRYFFQYRLKKKSEQKAWVSFLFLLLVKNI